MNRPLFQWIYVFDDLNKRFVIVSIHCICDHLKVSIFLIAVCIYEVVKCLFAAIAMVNVRLIKNI